MFTIEKSGFKKFQFAALLLLAGAAFTASAQSRDLSLEELKKVQSKVKSFDHLSVNFDQARTSSLARKVSKSSGKALFSKPDKFRWQLMTPLRDEWIFDGKQIFNFKPDDNRAVRYEPSGPNAKDIRQIVDLVMNFSSLLSRYDVSKSTQDGDIVSVELKPKSAGDIKTMEVRLDTKNGFVSYLQLSYADGSNSVFTFKNQKKEASLPTSSFGLPTGVKITDTK